MKILNIVLLLIGLLSTSCAAQQKINQSPRATGTNATSLAPTADEQALLWKIEGNGLATTSYLFGTIHMIGSDDFFLSENARTHIANAERVTFEINMEDMNDIGAQLGLMMNAFMKDGKTLKDLLSSEDYKVVNDHFEKMGMPLFLLERIKPMFLSVFASGEDMMGLQSGSMVSYEMEIMKLAQSEAGKEKEIAGLETAEYQMSMFDSIPYEAQAQMLVESIKSTDSGSDQFDEMVKLYKNQDLLGMSSMISADSEGGIGGYEDLLLVTRNKNWIPVMSDMMKSKPTFFAVGAGHLGGEQGVIALLRKEGYTLTAIEPTKQP